jgi:hypothetical protein
VLALAVGGWWMLAEPLAQLGIVLPGLPGGLPAGG